MRRLILALVFGAAAGCGATSPGGGTQTLFADVDVTGKSDSTAIRVTLRLRGNPVSNANVFLRDTDRDLSVTLEEDHAGEKAYAGTLTGYARKLELMITSGPDHLDAKLEGPAPHTITRPPNDAIVRKGSGSVLTVEWSGDGGADHVVVRPEKGAALDLDGDPGRADVPLEPLPLGDQRIEVERQNKVGLAGGTDGSEMRIRYQVDNRFTLEG